MQTQTQEVASKNNRVYLRQRVVGDGGRYITGVTDVVLQVPSEALSAPTRSRTYHL